MAEAAVRSATVADFPAIQRLMSELFEAMQEPPATDASSVAENYLNVLNDPAHHLLIATAGDSAVGFIHFAMRKTIAHRGPSALVDELVVAAKRRRQGIGKTLVAAAVQKCRSLGCAEIEVATEKANTGARGFYRKCGFDEDAVLLEKSIVE